MACSLARSLQQNISAAATSADHGASSSNEIRLFWWFRFRGSRRSHRKAEAFQCSHGLRCVSDSRPSSFASAHGVVVWVGSRPQSHCLPPRIGAHVWLLEYSESPAYYPELHSEAFTRQFDLKVSHELDSDIVLTALHPMVEGGVIPPEQWLGRPTRPPVSAVVWLASNCASRNDRELLARKLLAALPPTLPLHSIGRCMHTRDAPALAPQPAGGRFLSTWLSKVRVLHGYAFCLVAENSIAADYVTEKLFHAFAAGCLPVYYGTPSVERLLPHPMAIVRVLDFDSLGALVGHLRAIAANATLYREHLAWRDDVAGVHAWWLRMRTLTSAARTASKSDLVCEYCRIVQRSRQVTRAAPAAGGGAVGGTVAVGGVLARGFPPSPRPVQAVWPPLLSWWRRWWHIKRSRRQLQSESLYL